MIVAPIINWLNNTPGLGLVVARIYIYQLWRYYHYLRFNQILSAWPQFAAGQFNSVYLFMLETYKHANNYKNAKETCKRLMTSRFHAVKLYIVFEKTAYVAGKTRDKKTVNNKIVTLMRRDKQTNTSVVYVSTQKQRYKLNIVRTLKLADCMDIKSNNTIIYNNLHLDQK